MGQSSITLTARWIFPVEAPPLERGTVTVAGRRIVAVEPANKRAADVDFGDSAIVPGFVNAHTHLDLSDAAGRCPPVPDFTSWLRQVIQHRRQQTPQHLREAIRKGAADLTRSGTTLVGDISAQGASWDALEQAPLEGVVFHEVLGLARDRAKVSFGNLQYWLRSREHSDKLLAGVSPHAPYSVSRWLLEQASAECRAMDRPLAIHLGETDAEIELLERHQGPFVDFLQEMGVWSPEDLLEGWESLLAFDWSAQTLFVHGNVLKTDHSGLVGRSVVYCPRTHAAFGHGPHPFREMLERGVNVALGTDSLASNPDLNILTEARFLHRQHPEVPGADFLRMLTINGARALGDSFARRVGSLAAGKDANLVVVPLGGTNDMDPHCRLLGGEALPTRVMFRGAWIALG